jgi:TonB-dependent receptor
VAALVRSAAISAWLISTAASAQSVDAGSPAPDAAAVVPSAAEVARAALSDAGVSDAADLVADASTEPVAAPVPVVEPAPAAPESGAAGSPRKPPRTPGILRGSISSAADDVGLDGAWVYVRGTPEQVQTDGSGRYSITLPAGTYQLSVINPGYSTQNVSNVEVKPNQTVELNLRLQPGSVELDEMVVVGSRIRGGIATLVAERRESKAVADVIGAEQMARSGDSNAAAALARVTGITVIDGRYVIVRGMGERYSTMTLNRLQVASPDPTRRVVPLDIFPAGVIDSVVVQKSYTPDLPGEFGGGLVQLRSRDYPHEFSFNVNAATGGNFSTLLRERVAYEGGKYDLLGVDDGGRQLPDQFHDPRGKITFENEALGTGYPQDEINQLGKDLPHRYNTHSARILPDLTLGANIGNEYRLRHAKIGFVVAGGYRNESRNVLDATQRVYKADTEDYSVDTFRRQISLSGFLDWGVTFSASQKLKFTSMILRQTDDSVQVRTDNVNVAKTDRTVLQWVERQVFLQQVGGTHAFSKLKGFQVDWRYGFGLASRKEPMRGIYEYQYQDDQFVFAQNATDSFAKLKDTTHEGSIDLSQPFPMWKHLEGKVKLGGLFYRRDRDAGSRTFQYTATAEADRNGPPETVLADEHVGQTVNFEEVTRTTDSYDANMQVEAGYANLDLALHRSLDVSGGARLEHATIEAKTFDPFNMFAEPSIVKLDNLDVLPGVGLTWRFVEDFQARGGYSRTLNRPDFRELSPSRYFDLENNMLLEGNPDVKRARIENFDARVEWFYTPEEVFSVGGFVKRFQDPIENKVQRGQDDVYTVENVDKAISYGLELEGRKSFGFMAKVLAPMYLSSNVSLIHSKVEVPVEDGTIHKRPLQGQSPWVLNLQLGWDDSGEGGTGTSASLLFNTAGKRIRVVGDPGALLGDIYELPIHRLDFVFTQKLPRGFKIGARVRNILNAREKWVAKGGPMNEEQTWRRFHRGADFQINLSWNY